MTEREYLAAELALGLLEGEELIAARGLSASDPSFAALVADWEQRLVPMLDEVAAVAPAPAIWTQIAAAIDHSPAADGEVVALRRAVRRWQWTAGLSAAAAVALAFWAGPALLAPPPVAPPLAAAPAPLVASFTLPGTEARLSLTYLPDRSDLMVTAAGLAPDGVHDHELWLVPPEGETVSLGVVVPGTARRVRLPEAVAQRLQDGAVLALTREPLGGSQGRPAGPVVAKTKFFST